MDGPAQELPPPSLYDRTRQRLLHLGHHARKGLGQHFLVSRSYLGRIVRAAELGADDTVIEVGPGLGTLTHELAQVSGQVIAVELDDRLASALREETASLHHVHIVSGDILKLDLSPLTGNSDYKVVANLPYNIGTAVLRLFLETKPGPRLMVLTLQKEVAQSIISRPPNMTLLGVSVQFYAHPELITYIPPQAFYPHPQVSSAIVRVRPYPKPVVDVDNPAAFFFLVRAGFTTPRKQLINSLTLGLGIPKLRVQGLVGRAGIDPRRRAQTLELEEWKNLYQVFNAGEALRGAS